jgi:hypothetical protein
MISHAALAEIASLSYRGPQSRILALGVSVDYDPRLSRFCWPRSPARPALGVLLAAIMLALAACVAVILIRNLWRAVS